jgi:hypothetical protein
LKVSVNKWNIDIVKSTSRVVKSLSGLIKCDNNVFCNDINLLADTETKSKYNLKLHGSNMRYVTSVIALHDKSKWFINQEGKVWKEVLLRKREDCK